jgi:hypothetical protein
LRIRPIGVILFLRGDKISLGAGDYAIADGVQRQTGSASDAAARARHPAAILLWDAISIHFKQVLKNRIRIDGRSLPPSLLEPELEDREVQVRGLWTGIAG